MAGVLAAPSISIDDITNSTVSALDVVLAVIVLVVSWVLARIANRAVLRVTGRLGGISDDLGSLAARVTRYFFLLLGIGVALSILGAAIQPLLTAAVIVAVVAALAVRGVADNFAAGVVIQTRQPFHLCDEIDALGFVGVVRELNGRSVVIETYDGRAVHLPNAKVLDSPIVNHTTVGARRSEVEVRAAPPNRAPTCSPRCPPRPDRLRACSPSPRRPRCWWDRTRTGSPLGSASGTRPRRAPPSPVP
jgi:small conductance mechanosensitive channel